MKPPIQTEPSQAQVLDKLKTLIDLIRRKSSKMNDDSWIEHIGYVQNLRFIVAGVNKNKLTNLELLECNRLYDQYVKLPG